MSTFTEPASQPASAVGARLRPLAHSSPSPIAFAPPGARSQPPMSTSGACAGGPRAEIAMVDDDDATQLSGSEAQRLAGVARQAQPEAAAHQAAAGVARQAQPEAAAHQAAAGAARQAQPEAAAHQAAAGAARQADADAHAQRMAASQAAAQSRADHAMPEADRRKRQTQTKQEQRARKKQKEEEAQREAQEALDALRVVDEEDAARAATMAAVWRRWRAQPQVYDPFQPKSALRCPLLLESALRYSWPCSLLLAMLAAPWPCSHLLTVGHACTPLRTPRRAYTSGSAGAAAATPTAATPLATRQRGSVRRLGSSRRLRPRLERSR
jgi:hypothetical protein